MEEEGSDDVEEEDDNQFVMKRQLRRYPVTRDSSRRWESKFKLDIPEFKELFAVGRIFEFN